ncbi:hypothetical protein K443DRAFT_683472, partial [Laccaria amethystina LaAM-08-1]
MGTNVLMNETRSQLKAKEKRKVADFGRGRESQRPSNQRRVYPRGTRIQSSNFAPEVYWRSGTQVASLNWPRYDAGMQ